MNTPNQWQLSGNAAERYERVLVPAIFSPWATDLVALAKLRPGERVLDVACGTGVVARLAAERVGPEGHITGLDLNEGMLEVARSQPIPAGAAGVAWIHSSALAMRVSDSSFHVVLCQQGIQFFPDTPQALREMIRVLVPSGRVFISVWEGSTPYTTAMWNAVERHVGADAATMLRKSRVIEDPKALQDLMMQAGFRDVRIIHQTRTARFPAVGDFILRHLAATPVAQAVEALSDRARKALSEDAATALRPYADGDGIAFPEAVNVLTGIRRVGD